MYLPFCLDRFVICTCQSRLYECGRYNRAECCLISNLYKKIHVLYKTRWRVVLDVEIIDIYSSYGGVPVNDTFFV